MSPPRKKIKKQSSFNTDEPPRENNGPSISSLPDEIVLNCLLHVPRSYHLNLSCVSKTLRSLVRSPELHRLRVLHKNSVYVSFLEKDCSTYHWFTLHRNEKSEFRLVSVSVPIPFPPHPQSSTVAVGSEIFFVGGSAKASPELWILDTRSGELTQGASMKVARTCEAAVGVINGKIYVMGGCEDKIQVEVFDLKSRNWKVGESPGERLRRGVMMRLNASLDWKIYIEATGGIAVYDPREGRRMETLEMPSAMVWCMCVVDDVLYAYYFQRGLMWFDAKRKVWRRVVGGGGIASIVKYFCLAVAAECDGKLAILWPEIDSRKKEISCAMIKFDWVGVEEIHATLEWSGIVASVPDSYSLHNCLLVSN